MKNGFEVIKSRNFQDQVDIESMEKKYDLILPPLYKLFSKHFEMGDFKYDEYFDQNYNDKYQFTGVYYFPKGMNENNIGITSLYRIEKVFEDYKKLQGYCDEDVERGLIRIADIGIGGGLFIATKQEEVDNIILCIWDREPMHEKLTDNIFEFVRGLVTSILPEEDLVNLKYSQFYKNFGENFWRVRDERI